jgi:hypothetical protein
MRLVEQAAADRNLAEPEFGAQHHGLSKLNAPTPEKRAGTDAERLPECPAKVAPAQTCESRQISDRDSTADVRIEMSHEPLRLPRRQTPSNPQSSSSGLQQASGWRACWQTDEHHRLSAGV